MSSPSPQSPQSSTQSLPSRAPDYALNRIAPLGTARFRTDRYESISDCCVLVVHCPVHQRIALCRTSHLDTSPHRHFRWFPFAYILPNRTWSSTRRYALRKILGRYSASQITATEKHICSQMRWIELFRVQLPRTQRFVMRVMYYMQLNAREIDPCFEASQSTSSSASDDDSRIEWWPIHDAINCKIDNLWGSVAPIISSLSLSVGRKTVYRLNNPIREYSLDKMLRPLSLSSTTASFDRSSWNLNDPILWPSSSFSSSTLTRDEEMLIEANVTRRDIERMYDDYLEHTFPCIAMTIVSFKDYMRKRRIETIDERLDRYWYAFRFRAKPYMTFQELLIGLIATDRGTRHCETRIKMIFRFYDCNHDKKLNFAEFRKLFGDLYPNMNATQLDYAASEKIYQIFTNLSHSGKERASLSSSFSSIFGPMKTIFDKNMPIFLQQKQHRPRKSHHRHQQQPRIIWMLRNGRLSFNRFFRAIICRLLGGTSRLCRTKALTAIQHDFFAGQLQRPLGVPRNFRRVITTRQSAATKCNFCVQRIAATPYRLAGHMVWLNEKRELKRVAALQFVFDQFPRQQVWWWRHSAEIQFCSQSRANLYVKQIRDFSQSGAKGTAAAYRGLLTVFPAKYHAQFVLDIENICADTYRLVQSEGHLVDIAAPVCVIGDIHGNIEDLLTLEGMLWPSVPFFAGNRFLFLGDYVDRGRWGFECAIYLFCLKNLAPERVTLLRGNHEIRYIQRDYSYHAELIKKYGEKIGERFFEITNRVFDCLPYCAVIDRQVFAAHGGIPYSDDICNSEPIRTAISRIAKGESPVSVDNGNTGMLWEILWSDPLENLELRAQYELELDDTIVRRSNAPATEAECAAYEQYKNGYLFNKKRGTAYYFSEFAFSVFCARNGVTHMIRGHEVPLDGFRLNFARRCITTFSCSHYCGIDNRCSVVQLIDDRIRIVQITTQQNSAATEQ